MSDTRLRFVGEVNSACGDLRAGSSLDERNGSSPWSWFRCSMCSVPPAFLSRSWNEVTLPRLCSLSSPNCSNASSSSIILAPVLFGVRVDLCERAEIGVKKSRPLRSVCGVRRPFPSSFPSVVLRFDGVEKPPPVEAGGTFSDFSLFKVTVFSRISASFFHKKNVHCPFWR